MSKDIMIQVMQLVVTVVITMWARYVLPYLKQKMENEKLDKVLRYAKEAVRAAEQIYSAKEPKIKKLYVMQHLNKLAKKAKIDLTKDELELLIEAAVNAMNNEDYLTVKPEDYEHMVQAAEPIKPFDFGVIQETSDDQDK